MYTYCKEILPPSAVHYTCSCSFRGPGLVEILVVRGNLLQLYTINHTAKQESELLPSTSTLKTNPLEKVSEEAESTIDAKYLTGWQNDEQFPFPEFDSLEFERVKQKNCYNLVLINQWRLLGKPRGISRIKGASKLITGADKILISFAVAKMSVIEFNPYTQSITTSSIHFYEHEKFQTEQTTDEFYNKVEVDPNQMCAVMSVYSRFLAVLSLTNYSESNINGQTVIESSDVYEMGIKRKIEKSSFVVDLSDESLNIKNVKDFVFLNDYNEPTLAILYEPVETWAGNLAVLSDSCCIAVVSVNLATDSLSIIYQINNLPFDTFKLVPLTKPIGGILAIASTSIIHITQGLIVYILATSAICKTGAGEFVSNFLDTTDQPCMNLDWRLDGAQVVLIGFKNILLWNELGEFGLIELFGDVRGVNKIKIELLIHNETSNNTHNWNSKTDSLFALVPSSISTLQYKLFDEYNNEILDYTKLDQQALLTVKKTGYVQALVFIGTLGGFSLLITVKLKVDNVNLEVINSKITNIQDLDSVDDLLYQDTFNYNDNNFSSFANTKKNNTNRNKNKEKHDQNKQFSLDLEIHDKLICAAPLIQIDIGESSLIKSGLFGEDNLEIVGSVGIGPQGGLVVMQRSIRPSILASFDIAFTQSKLHKKYQVDNLLLKNVWFVSLKNSMFEPSSAESFFKNSFGIGSLGGLIANLDTIDLVITSSESISTIFQVKNGLIELVNTEFSTNKPTLLVGQIKNDSSEILLAVQVCSDSISVIDSASVNFDDHEYAIQADVLGTYIVLKMSSHKIYCYFYSFESKLLVYIKESACLKNLLHFSLYSDYHYGFSKLSKDLQAQNIDKEDSPMLIEKVTNGAFNSIETEINENVIKDQISDIWLVCLDSDYSLKIYLLPRMECIWSVERIDNIPDLLQDSYLDNISNKDDIDEFNKDYSATSNINSDLKASNDLNSTLFSNTKKKINQIRLANLGNDKFDSYLVILMASSQIVVYKSFSENLISQSQLDSSSTKQRIDWKMNRIQTNIFTHFPNYEKIARNLNGWEDEFNLENEKDVKKAQLETETAEKQNKPDIQNIEKDITLLNEKKPDHLADENLVDTLFNETISDDLFESVELTGDAANIKNEEDHVFEVTDKNSNAKNAPLHIPFHFKYFEFNKLIPFYNMNEYNGMFIMGATPVWLLVGKKKYPRLHPVKLVAPKSASVSRAESSEVLESYTKSMLMSSIIGWSPLFNQSNNEIDPTNSKPLWFESSFVAITWSGTLVIASLPINTIDYDNPWPTIFMPIGGFSGTGLLASLAYHPTTKNYITVSTQLRDFYLKDSDIDSLTQIEESKNIPEKDDNREQQASSLPVEQKRLDVATTTMPPKNRISTLELLSPVTFETIDTFNLEANEIITCMKTLMLESQQTDSGKKNFLVVGTVFMLGEDYLTRGHVYIFDIINVVPDPSNLERSKKFKRLCREEMRGGVSSIENLENNYLMVAVGNKLYARSFRDNENLVSVAFLDCQVYVKSIASIKNYFVVSDYFQSVWFAGFQDEPSKILVLSRDSNYIQASSSNFLVYGNSLGILVADQFGNIQTFIYDPNNLSSFSGQKLIKCGDFHLGSNVTYMKRLVGKYDHRLWANASGNIKISNDKNTGQQSNLENAQQILKSPSNLEFCLLSCDDGALHVVIPISERDFKKLAQIHNHIIATNQFIANLNPKAYRASSTNNFTNNNNVGVLRYGFSNQGGGARKYTLDANIINDYLVNGSSIRQREYCSKLGTNPEIVLSGISLLESSVDLF
ncbi:hypothetical protein BB561_003937 [Smittium simulii]|uniref:Uncharacterized protein n=1 Tax=Smittium simulii TaxID=133385 RepID=A0A2T9YIV9_9FUNG|nr:hypothetical protein BB561_003937 [Smittium simulii]